MNATKESFVFKRGDFAIKRGPFAFKIISALTLFFFSVSNISSATPFPLSTSSLRAMSLAVSAPTAQVETALAPEIAAEKAEALAKEAFIEAVFVPEPATEKGEAPFAEGQPVTAEGQPVTAEAPAKGIFTEQVRLLHTIDLALVDVGLTPGVKSEIHIGWDVKDGDAVKTTKLIDLEPSTRYKVRLKIHKDFQEQFNEAILNNDVILDFRFSDGKTEKISLAYRLARYSVMRFFAKDEGYKDKRYAVIDSAIWLWYHFLYYKAKKAKEAVKSNEEPAAFLNGVVFEIINNPDEFQKRPESHIKEILNFREEIPFILKDKNLQKQAKRIALIINALFFNIKETIPEPRSLNLLEVSEDLIRSNYKSKEAMWTALDSPSLAGKYGRVLRDKTKINSRGYKAFITDKNLAFIAWYNLSYHQDKLVIDEPQDVSRGLHFSDDGRYVICAGNKKLKIYNLPPQEPDRVIVTKDITSPHYKYEFFSKDAHNEYRYVLIDRYLSTRPVVYSRSVSLFDLKTGNLLLEEEAKKVLAWRILKDGRYLELSMEKESTDLPKGIYIKDASMVKIYDLQAQRDALGKLLPIIVKRGESQMGSYIEFDSNFVSNVADGQSELFLIPKTGEAASLSGVYMPELFYSDKDSPDVSREFIDKMGFPTRVIRHKGLTAVFQKVMAQDFDTVELPSEDAAKLMFSRHYKVAVIDSDNKVIMEDKNPVVRRGLSGKPMFWFAPNGEYALYWNKNRGVVMQNLTTPESTYFYLDHFDKLKEVKVSADSRYIILSGIVGKSIYGYPCTKIFYVSDFQERRFVGQVAGFYKRLGLFYFHFEGIGAGQKNIVCHCLNGVEITIDKKTAKIVDISIPEKAEEPRVKKAEVTPTVTPPAVTQPAQPLAPTYPPQLHSFGKDEQGRPQYRLELEDKKLRVIACATESELIKIKHDGLIDYRIIEDKFIEVTRADRSGKIYDRAIYDPQYEIPLVRATKFGDDKADPYSWLPWWHRFNEEQAKRVVCLFSQDRDSNEQTAIFDPAKGELLETAKAKVAKKQIRLDKPRLMKIFEHLESDSFEPKDCKIGVEESTLTVRLLDEKGAEIAGLFVYPSPDGKYIVYIDKKEGIFAGIYNIESGMMHTYRIPFFSGAKISDDSRYITFLKKIPEADQREFEEIYRYDSKKGPTRIASIMRTEEVEDGKKGYLFYFSHQLLESGEGVKRVAIESEDERMLWFSDLGGVALYVNSCLGAEKKRITNSQFAKMLGYDSYQAHLDTIKNKPQRMSRSGHYILATSADNKKIAVAKLFPDDRRLELIMVVDGAITLHRFTGPDSEWLITIGEPGPPLKVYNLEADNPSEPIYACWLKDRNLEHYSVSSDGLWLVTIESRPADYTDKIKVVDLSNPKELLQEWDVDSDLGDPCGLTGLRFDPNKNRYLRLMGISRRFFGHEALGQYLLDIRTGEVSDARALKQKTIDDTKAKSSSAGVNQAEAIQDGQTTGRPDELESVKVVSQEKLDEILRSLGRDLMNNLLKSIGVSMKDLINSASDIYSNTLGQIIIVTDQISAKNVYILSAFNELILKKTGVGFAASPSKWYVGFRDWKGRVEIYNLFNTTSKVPIKPIIVEEGVDKVQFGPNNKFALIVNYQKGKDPWLKYKVYDLREPDKPLKVDKALNCADVKFNLEGDKLIFTDSAGENKLTVSLSSGEELTAGFQLTKAKSSSAGYAGIAQRDLASSLPDYKVPTQVLDYSSRLHQVQIDSNIKEKEVVQFGRKETVRAGMRTPQPFSRAGGLYNLRCVAAKDGQPEEIEGVVSIYLDSENDQYALRRLLFKGENQYPSEVTELRYVGLRLVQHAVKVIASYAEALQPSFDTVIVSDKYNEDFLHSLCKFGWVEEKVTDLPAFRLPRGQYQQFISDVDAHIFKASKAAEPVDLKTRPLSQNSKTDIRLIPAIGSCA